MKYGLRGILLCGGLIPLTIVAQVRHDAKSYVDGIAAFHEGHFGEAVKLLDKSASEINVFERSLPLSALGALYAEVGNMKAAERSLKAASEVGIRNAVIFSRRMDFYVRTGRTKDAEAVWKEALPYVRGSRAVVQAVYAESLIGAGRLDEAEALIADARAKLADRKGEYPWDFAWALVRAARIAEIKGDFKAAIAQSLEAFTFAQPRWFDGSPVVLAAMDVYGTALAKDGQTDKARAVLERALELRRAQYLATSPAVLGTFQRLSKVMFR